MQNVGRPLRNPVSLKSTGIGTFATNTDLDGGVIENFVPMMCASGDDELVVDAHQLDTN